MKYDCCCFILGANLVPSSAICRQLLMTRGGKFLSVPQFYPFVIWTNICYDFDKYCSDLDKYFSDLDKYCPGLDKYCCHLDKYIFVLNYILSSNWQFFVARG